jgi:murein DD-endopeptidase / murein LD-carboxypeptidase
MSAERAVRRARACIGSPFRLHGRSAATGLDCVGLVALAYDIIDVAPDGYALRNGEGDRWEAVLDRCFSRRLGPGLQSGDILFMHGGPNQFHLGIWDGDGLIHADTRIRRVVQSPGRVAWPVIGTWFDQ